MSETVQLDGELKGDRLEGDRLEGQRLEGQRLERTGRRWLLWSFILCPCHLPWTLAILAAVFGGTSLGVVVNQYRTALGITIAVLYAIGVGIGFRYLRRAKARGACKVRFQ